MTEEESFIEAIRFAMQEAVERLRLETGGNSYRDESGDPDGKRLQALLFDLIVAMCEGSPTHRETVIAFKGLDEKDQRALLKKTIDHVFPERS